MKIGDKVKVVDFGHLMWSRKPMSFKVYAKDPDSNVVWYDCSPEIVGKEGVIKDVKTTQGQTNYALSGITEKSAWYSENQLELIK